MMRTPTTGRRGALGFSIILAMMLAGATVAWACTPMPTVTFRGSQGSGSTSSAGPAGSEQTVEGSGWDARDVDIRWNSAAGSKLVNPSPRGPGFSVKITIPNVEPGVYTIYFVQPDDGTRSAVARVSFEVTPEASTSGGGETGGGDNTSGQTSAETSGAEGGSSSSGGNTASRTSGGTRNSSSSTPNDGGTQSFGAPAPSSSDATPAGSTAARETPTAARPGATSGSGGQAVFAGSVGSDTPAPAAPQGVTEEVPSASGLRVVSGDLYSGFDASGDASLLPDVADSPLAGTYPVGAPALIAGLFAAALVALFGGFAGAEVRRRKATQPAS